MAGGSGGAWKVAYADFVTAMMAFFMVMWLTSQNEAIKEAVAHHFEDPFSPYEPIDGANSAKPKSGASSKHPLPKRPDDKKGRRTRKPTVIIQGEGNQTTTGTIIFFEPGSAELDEAAKTQLSELLPSILGKPQKIEIRGHASRRPLPPESPHADAWQLSYSRCLSTMKYLQEQGIGAERLRLSQAGVYEPSGDADGPDKLADQERVEVNLLNELARDSLTGTGGAADRAPAADEPAENAPREAAPQDHPAEQAAAAHPAEHGASPASAGH